MPVKSADLMETIELLDDFSDDVFARSSIADFIMGRPIVSDDIWEKFDLDFPELSGVDDIFDEIEASDNGLFPLLDEYQIRNHDCMWAGHCASKEHPADELCVPMHWVLNNPTAALKPPVPVVKREMTKPPVPCQQQQSLLKPTVRAAAASTTAVVHTPQTPPMSDDEENKGKPTQLLKFLHHAISECDLDDEDSDLCEYRCEYFEDDDEDLDVEVETPPQPNIRTCQYAAENDHSYHKDKNASMQVPNLGIDTPSDSEEEIDVVSIVAEKTNSRTCSLPTNPSVRDRHQIQRRMATAITTNRMNNGIKTILPVRKSSITTETVQTKRKTAESRVTKRPRQYRTPYKRRTANSSDSEAEPSEKRSLHNNMERQRRIDLRNAFEELRVLVPEVSKKEKAAKVVILREAAKYCYQLSNVNVDCNDQLEQLRREQEKLRRRVSMLRRNLAATR